VFATEALGMGVDISDIRRIIHIGPPYSIESMNKAKIDKFLLNIKYSMLVSKRYFYLAVSLKFLTFIF